MDETGELQSVEDARRIAQEIENAKMKEKAQLTRKISFVGDSMSTISSLVADKFISEGRREPASIISPNVRSEPRNPLSRPLRPPIKREDTVQRLLKKY